MATAKELREKRAPIAKRIKELSDKANADKRDFTPEEQKSWTDANAEYDALTKDIGVAERTERAETVAKEQEARAAPLPPPGREDYDAGAEQRKRGERPADGVAEQRAIALQAWFRRQCHNPSLKRLTDEHKRACDAVGLDPDEPEISIRLVRTDRYAGVQAAFREGGPRGAESRALSAITAADGGAITSPESMVQQLEMNMLAYGGVLQSSQVIRTGGRERMRWPTVNDTSNKGRRLGESAVVTSTAQPTFAGVYWDVYKYTSDEILVPFELLAGTPFDLPSILGQLMGERIGRKLADDFTTGTGVNQPKGIVTAATSFSAASATAIAWDDLENLINAVDPAYRIGAGFMFHDNIRAALKKLKDGIGRPLWADAPNGGQPTLLKDYPFFINQSMDSTIASGKKSILFGQLSKYKVREVDSIRIYRLTERHRENDQDAFLAFLEADGNLLDAGTAPVKYLAH